MAASLLLFGCVVQGDDDFSDDSVMTIASRSQWNVASRNRFIAFSFSPSFATEKTTYQWYECASLSGESPVALFDETASTFVTPSYTENGMHFYYCVATNRTTGQTEHSIVYIVAHTGLPTVYLETPDHAEITSKTTWLEGATIAISGAKQARWNFAPVSMSIRGRGNSTWYQPKKPYALKLAVKQRVLGMPAHKRWVLMANYLDNSFMRNEMAFYLSEQFGLDWTIHGTFVDLVLNGEYKGLYWLGEGIKPDKNRVNINNGTASMTDDEDKDYLIEMDVYFDEPVKFHSPIRTMPYMIKNDDYMIDESGMLTAGGAARLARLQEKIAALEQLLYPDFAEGMRTADCAAPDESYTDTLDVDSWAKFWLVNEIMDNGELGHPKSCYFSFESTRNIFKAGPVWDFDWASLSQATSCRLKNTLYYDALFKSPSFVSRVQSVWAEHADSIDIAAQIEAMRAQISVAATYDALRWGVNHNPAGMNYASFDGHVDFLKDTLLKKYAVVAADIDGW